MEDQPYTKRELDHFFVELGKRLDHQDAMLSEIKMQTTKTNGRVNRLEFWKTALIWTVSVMWTLLPIAVVLLYKLQRLQSIQDAYAAAKAIRIEQRASQATTPLEDKTQ